MFEAKFVVMLRISNESLRTLATQGKLKIQICSTTTEKP